MRRTAVLAALAAVVLTGGLAQGAPKGAADPVTAPYEQSYQATRDSCADGATCVGSSSATDDGRVVATSDYTRDEAVEGQESQVSWGGYRFRYQPLGRSSTVTATITWLVTAASAEGDADQGDVFGQAWVESFGSCGKGCSVTEDRYVVVDGMSRKGVLPWVSGDDDHPAGFPTRVTDERVVVTLTWTGKLPARLDGGTSAAAATAGYPQNLCLVEGTRPCAVDTGHAGSAHTELDARLLSITFEESR